MVAGAWMGLAVKTDGAAVAAGAMADSLIRAKAQAVDGVTYQKDWIMGTATTVKVFIDVFIGIWSCILAAIWCTKIEGKPGGKVPFAEIWERFPKFVFGYLITFLAVLLIAVFAPGLTEKAKTAMGEANGFRGIFFCHDLLFDRRGVEFQEALGRGDWPPGRRLCRLPVRVHHLDRAADLLAVLPRRKTATYRRLKWRNQPKIVDELKKMEYEPLLPVEKKLIVGSLVLGVVLLGLLLWVSRVFFPG